MPVYKNLTDQDLTLPGFGICKANGTIDSGDKIIENKNFEIEGQSATPAQPTAPVAPAPQAPNPAPSLGGTK